MRLFPVSVREVIYALIGALLAGALIVVIGRYADRIINPPPKTFEQQLADFCEATDRMAVAFGQALLPTLTAYASAVAEFLEAVAGDEGDA